MRHKIERQIGDVRRRIDALADSGDVSEDTLRSINILTVKLANLKKQNTPYQTKAFSYHYNIEIPRNMQEAINLSNY